MMLSDLMYLLDKNAYMGELYLTDIIFKNILNKN